LTVGATPANLAPDSDFSSCPNLEADLQLCFWQYAGYSGTFWDFNIWQSDGFYTQWQYIGDRYNNIASAAYNKRDDASYVAKTWYPGPGTDQACFPSQAAYPNFADYGWPQDGTGMDNTISALVLLDNNAC
jgi:hypothetical protein